MSDPGEPPPSQDGPGSDAGAPSDPNQQAAADEAMHIHKPKAAHSLQEFAVEIGIIVVGILIALSLEQGVEALRSHQEAQETDRALQREVRTDLGEAIQGVIANGCYRARIAELTRKLTAPGDTWNGEYETPKVDRFGGQPAVAAAILPIAFGTMTHNLWDSPAVTSGLSHLDASRAHRYSDIYRYVAALQGVTEDIMARESELQPLAFDQTLDPAARREYLRSLTRLDQDVYYGYNITGFVVERARQNGIEPDAADVAHRFAVIRSRLGACVQPYAPPRGIRDWAEQLDRVDEASPAR
jgi:hypothetical protein